MKRILITLTMLIIGIGSISAQFLDRTGWTVLASSACNDSSSGQANYMLDGSTATWWHSNYGGGNSYGTANSGCPHAFQLDLGSEKSFYGVQIKNRSDAEGNGRVKSYEIYVSNEPFTSSTTGFSANAVKSGKTPALTGTFSNSSKGAINRASGTTLLKGRYVLFVITDSYNSNGTSTKHAAIAEVDLLSIPSGHNAYIGAAKTIISNEWKTQSNWDLKDTWNNNGPGYNGSNMWSPIYLQDVTATGIAFEGWNLRLKLVSSKLTATTNKLQAGGEVTINVDKNSTLDLTMSGGNADPGLHTFNIDGVLKIKTNSDHFTNTANGSIINLGTTGQFTFTSDATVTVSRSFTLNATLTDPTEHNNVESRTLATFTNVTVNTLPTNISGTEGWTLVGDKDALETQTTDGKYYYLETGSSSGATLHRYHRYTIYDVPASTTETLSHINGYNTYSQINVPSGSTLIIDVENFDLTKITGAGTVVLDANITFSGNKSTVAAGKLTINEGKTLTIGGGDTQTNSIASFTSIDLAGTIKHNNSKATLNKVTVPTGKTGNIFAYDMGSDADGFKLAGTTTLNGNLTICSRSNAQIKVDELAGSGTWLICGTTGESFDETKTASDQAAVINVAAATTFTGTINVNNTNAAATISDDLGECEIKKTRGTVNYAGNKLNGTTLDGVVLSSTTNRVSTSGIVNIKNLAGCNLPNNNSESNYGYAFVGSGTINFYGICDLTKKADGTDALSSNLGYGSSATIVVKENATLKAGVLFNTRQSENNASITVESGGTLTAIGWTHDNGVLYAKNLVNNGTVNISTGRLTSGYGISTIHNTLSGSGTLNIAEGSNFNVASIPNTSTLTGAGVVVLTSFPTSSAPTLSSWTGTVQFPDGGNNSTDLQAIFNAWGNTNSTIKLNNVSGGYLGKDGTVNPTLNILSGKTLTLNNGYSDSNSTITRVTGAGTLDRQGWSGSKNHNLYITTLTDFTGTLKGTGHPIIVKKLVVASAPYANGLLIKTSGDVSLEQLYVGLVPTTAYTWAIKTVEEVEGIYVATFNEVQLRREMAAATVSPYFNHIGTGVGEYTISLGLNEKYTSIPEFTDAIVAWSELSDCSTPIVTINQPTSAFYRIKSDDNKYLQDVRKSDSETQRTLTDAKGADEAAETIFYLNSNTLVGYKTGYGFGFSVCQTQDTEHLNSMLFTESTETGMGKYTIQSQQGTYASADDNEGYWGVEGSDLSRENDAANGACWTLEAVTSLPVTITAAGYATFNSPVAVSIPEGVTAFQAKISGNKDCVNLVSIDDGVIPANFPVVLKGAEGTYKFPITTTPVVAGDYHSNTLQGTIAAISVSSTIYTLQKNSDETGVGFYEKTNGTLKGFSAYLTDVSGLRGFIFNEITGIDNTVIDNVTIENAYDLSGRRAGKVKKGVYILDGKKVLF